MYRILCIGEILFDIYPLSQCLGGAPFNFAFHLHQADNTVAFVSRIGNDILGDKIEGILCEKGFDTTYVQKDTSLQTGKVFVELDSTGNPSFTIVENVAYDAISEDASVKKFIQNGLDLIYFGTLAQRGIVSRATIAAFLDQAAGDTLIFYDINLRQHFYTEQIILDSLRKCTILKANEEELIVLKNLLSLNTDEMNAVFHIAEQFHIPHICITRGASGASLYNRGQVYHSANGKSDTADRIIDTVGAGDAFSAVLAQGILEHWPCSYSVNKAHSFAKAICTIEGALPKGNAFYKANWPVL
jgi:fructokinase